MAVPRSNRSCTLWKRTITQFSIGPECFAEIHPEDAEALSLQAGDRIIVESENAKVEVPVKTSYVTTRGMIYIPQNWVDVPVNLLRNGEEGLVPIKVSKAG